MIVVVVVVVVVQALAALGAGQGKADRAEARHSKRASRAKAEHSRRGGRAKPGNTLCKNNNTAAFGGCAAATPPQLFFLQRALVSVFLMLCKTSCILGGVGSEILAMQGQLVLHHWVGGGPPGMQVQGLKLHCRSASKGKFHFLYKILYWRGCTVAASSPDAHGSPGEPRRAQATPGDPRRSQEQN